MWFRCKRCNDTTRVPHLLRKQCIKGLLERFHLAAQCARIIEGHMTWLLELYGPDAVRNREGHDLADDLKKVQTMAQHIMGLAEGGAVVKKVMPPALQPKKEE